MVRWHCTTVDLLPGETMCPLAGPGFLFVDSGGLREEIAEGCGSRVFALIFPGELVPPASRNTRGVTLRAVDHSRLIRCDAEVFQGLVRDIPQLRLNMIRAHQDQIEQAVRGQMILGRKIASERVATFLADAWLRLGCAAEIPLGLSRDEMGQILGLALETVSRHLRRLEMDGIVELRPRGAILLLDPQALFQRMGD
ncbi:Crp/Fnr family transcriptional regulator [Paragemmobacter ruber]|uniref:Helix-turn-helix domain-containing protein n=1 Tax=Paragemmobacter ruber TaxID=1985673 RepID=A0ABW9Y2J0_9RHOB|nr:helix-turn-helix domain-containing protein [Rhodobacter ruber]NBE06449.1 helix-turn-helix domain-containing protein [Rhodobacter ruber]